MEHRPPGAALAPSPAHVLMPPLTPAHPHSPQHYPPSLNPHSTLPLTAGLRDERDLSIATRLGCGALAGTMGQTLAYPFDVVRRRLQVSGWSGAKQLHAGGCGAVRWAVRGSGGCEFVCRQGVLDT